MWEKRNPSTVRGNVYWNSHCRKQHGDSSKKLTTGLLILYSPSIPPLSMHPEKIKHQFRKLHAPQHSQLHYLQQPRHRNNPTAHQQMTGLRRCGIYHTMEYYSAIKKNEILHLQQHGQTQRIFCLMKRHTDKYKYCSIALKTNTNE